MIFLVFLAILAFTTHLFAYYYLFTAGSSDFGVQLSEARCVLRPAAKGVRARAGASASQYRGAQRSRRAGGV